MPSTDVNSQKRLIIKTVSGKFTFKKTDKNKNLINN